jgi:hypothetical protein
MNGGHMTTITIDDTLIKDAREVTTMQDDDAIVTEALQSFILDMREQAQAKQYYGKLHWNAEFAGQFENSECSR